MVGMWHVCWCMRQREGVYLGKQGQRQPAEHSNQHAATPCLAHARR